MPDFIVCLLAYAFAAYVFYHAVVKPAREQEVLAEAFLDEMQETMANADIWQTLSEDGESVRGLNLAIDPRMGLWIETEKDVFIPMGADTPEMWGIPPQQEDVDRG